MLALISLFLVTFIIAACAIWGYRMVSGAQRYQGNTVVRKRADSSMKRNAQNGYISWGRKSSKQAAKAAKAQSSKARPQLRSANSINKVPWGW